jgi:hypothetical protein
MRTVITILFAAFLVSAVTPHVSAGEPAYGFKFGGFFKTDAMYDNTRIHPGENRFWVLPYGDEKNNEFFLTVMDTRLGFDFWWKEESYTTKAKLEFDFHGLANAKNKPQSMLRHAYFVIKHERWSLLAGQTWDIIAPLNPSTVNYSVMWLQGNVGYRRPQIRVSTWLEPSEDSKVKLDVGVSTNLGGDIDGDGLDDGADRGFPSLQGRVGFATKIMDEGSLAIGASGHFGQDSWGPNDSNSSTSWSVCGDLSIKINKKIALLGEFWTGENMKQYLGGISQDFDSTDEPLPAMGGWGMVRLKPADAFLFNIGFGTDMVSETDWCVPDDGDPYAFRDMNREIFGNCMYNLSKTVTAMFEIAFMTTSYTTKIFGQDSTSQEYDALRFQLAFKAAIK